MNGQQSQSRDNRAGEKGIHPPNKNITTTLAQGLLDLDPKSLLNIDLDSIFNPNVTTLQAQGKNDDLDFESYPINPLGVEETYNSPSGSNAIFEAQLNGSEVGYRIPRGKFRKEYLKLSLTFFSFFFKEIGSQVGHKSKVETPFIRVKLNMARISPFLLSSMPN